MWYRIWYFGMVKLYTSSWYSVTQYSARYLGMVICTSGTSTWFCRTSERLDWYTLAWTCTYIKMQHMWINHYICTYHYGVPVKMGYLFGKKNLLHPATSVRCVSRGRTVRCQLFILFRLRRGSGLMSTIGVSCFIGFIHQSSIKTVAFAKFRPLFEVAAFNRQLVSVLLNNDRLKYKAFF